MEITKLFEPLQLADVTLHNRVIMGSMHLGLEGMEESEEALISFYTERSGKNGPGLIITGGIAVSPEGEGGSHFMGFYNKDHCKTMQKLTDKVHEANGKIAAQLFHAGRYAYSALTGKEAVAPSPLKSLIHPAPPRELTGTEIENLIKSFAESALKAKQLGFDAVEIMGSEGYLLNQFLSPVTNIRSDQWGGSFEKRSRFPLAVLEAVRQKVGSEYPVLFRLSGNDLMPGSTTEEETCLFAKMTEKAGADAINVGIGWHESRVPTISMMVPRAGFIDIASKIKQTVSIPVIGSNRINDPILAEEILQTNKADLISMARPFLADPAILQKAQEKRFNFINTCIACNQACLDHAFEGKPVSCLVNPRAGRESKWKHTKATARQTVIVIGGGAAGMEAARSQAEQGHTVHLFEKTDKLGGQLNLAKKVPGKEEFYETIRYYTHELNRLGVHIHLNKAATDEELNHHSPDRIIVATGVTPRIPGIEGIDGENVVTYAQVLSNEAVLGKRIAVIGAGGIGCDIAHYLLEQKGVEEITLLRRNGKMGEGLGKTTKWALLSHLRQKGVKFVTDLTYKQITEKGIEIVSSKTGETELIQADTIILAAGQESVNPALSEITKVDIIGGARLAGELDAKRAIYEGARLAYEEQVTS
ncbi:NADPH-dependent 2,4-dienoyl-CoA reductase [Pseudalkalibacillus caeni]|uniref:FAD-binding protein n=1 Tax=Exobacillus caeni TaxID=2574798 RepID=A0A5R9EVW0_9BACL|nr:NADPH-dependent 2,4-dienoyl-CoA reductase [Pseudalkalibacillus caeni]TLS34941.1 FAD-binding protein [Pseudalkalibacillus caeni]